MDLQGRHVVITIGSHRIGARLAAHANDGNAAAMYAHHVHFGMAAAQRSSVSAFVGTGLGGGVIEAGDVVSGASGMAGELGHVHVPMDGLLVEGQPVPRGNRCRGATAASAAMRKAWHR